MKLTPNPFKKSPDTYCKDNTNILHLLKNKHKDNPGIICEDKHEDKHDNMRGIIKKIEEVKNYPLYVYSPTNGFIDHIDFNSKEWYIIYINISVSKNNTHPDSKNSINTNVIIPMDGVLSQPSIRCAKIGDPILRGNDIYDEEIMWNIQPIPANVSNTVQTVQTSFVCTESRIWLNFRMRDFSILTSSGISPIKINIPIDKKRYYVNGNKSIMAEINRDTRIVLYIPKKYYTINSKLNIRSVLPVVTVATIREEQGPDDLIMGSTILATYNSTM